MKLQQTKTKTLLIALTLFASAHTGQAQTILLEPAEHYIGISGGATGSMLYFNPVVNQTYVLGYNGGVTYRFVTEKHFGLQIETNYSQRGWHEANIDYSRQMNYLELPLLTHLYWGKTNRFIFNLGPKFSYLLNEKVLTDDHTKPDDEQRKPAANKFEYGIAAGLGYNLHLRSAGTFQLELRGYYGLSSIYPGAMSDYFSNSNHINVALNFGYFFQLTGKEKKKQEEAAIETTGGNNGELK